MRANRFIRPVFLYVCHTKSDSFELRCARDIYVCKAWRSSSLSFIPGVISCVYSYLPRIFIVQKKARPLPTRELFLAQNFYSRKSSSLMGKYISTNELTRLVFTRLFRSNHMDLSDSQLNCTTGLGLSIEFTTPRLSSFFAPGPRQARSAAPLRAPGVMSVSYCDTPHTA